MGLSFQRPVSADFSIRAFSLRDENNADGWGLAWYPDSSCALVKEALTWRRSGYSKFLESYQGLKARIYIAHVRHKTTGGAATHATTIRSKTLHQRFISDSFQLSPLRLEYIYKASLTEAVRFL